MPWWVWILLALYIVGAAFGFQRIAGQWAWHFAANGMYGPKPYPTGEHWFGGVAMGLLLCLVWPVSLPVAHGIATARVGNGRLFYTPPNVRERLYKERIEQLEREAGIR